MIKEKNTTTIFFLLVAFFAQSFSGSDKIQCLKVEAIPIKNGLPLSGVIVSLFEGNKAIEKKTIPDAGGKFQFMLKRNSYYTLKISKNGLVTRKISFDTSLPNEVRNDPPFSFKFKVGMIVVSDIINEDYVDYPIAIVKYDEERDVFDYSPKYTNAIKNFLSKTTKDGITLIK